MTDLICLLTCSPEHKAPIHLFLAARLVSKITKFRRHTRKYQILHPLQTRTALPGQMNHVTLDQLDSHGRLKQPSPDSRIHHLLWMQCDTTRCNKA
jgi:hypothetical protein